MMRINMSKEMYENLTLMCRSDKKEQAGQISATIVEKIIDCTDYRLFGQDMISDRNKNEITYNHEQHVATEVLQYANMNTKRETFINFHTHPGFGGLAALSQADKEMLDYEAKIASTVCAKFKKQLPIVAEAVVTMDRIGIYRYDYNTGTIEQLPIFVNGLEVGSKERNNNIWQAFKDGFTSGCNRAKRER